jgi:alpha-galactosidase
MTKITFIGAGSVVFTRELLGAIYAYPELRNANIALHDIDPRRLDAAERMARLLSKAADGKGEILATTDLGQALDGTDYVINTVAVGGLEATRKDNSIPAKYGIHQVIGDTLGIGGISRAARTIPAAVGFAREMEKRCPDALMLNYSNPMSMVTWGVYAATKIKVVGLCHSMYWTTKQLTEYIGAPFNEITFDGAGINHQAWLLRFERNGKDAYPALRAAMQDPEIWKQDTVRFEMFKRLGYFVTESSLHNAEYSAYFLKSQALIDKFQSPVGFYVRLSEEHTARFDELYEGLKRGDPLEPKLSPEYAPQIINAIETDAPLKIYGNVRNDHLIDNLPAGCCVEVPTLIDKTGLHPTHVGELPPHLAAINRVSVNVQELTVRAVLEGKRDYLYHAAMLDPLVMATLDLDQVWSLMDELLEAHKEFIPANLLTDN